MFINRFKLKFFLYHLIASFSLIAFIAFLCQLYWFPAPFLMLDGTWVAILIIAGVDITLGPLLTLLLVSSQKTKRELTSDMLIIITIQVAALVYGLLQIEKERVIAIVHFQGAFHSVAKKELTNDEKKLLSVLPQYNGIYYGMVPTVNILPKNSKPFLYSPQYYQHLSHSEVIKNVFPYKNLPNTLQGEYHQEYIFKVLVGKKRAANIVIDNSMNIQAIELIPLKNKSKL